MKLQLDKGVTKLQLNSYLISTGLADEACALEVDYLKIQGSCNNLTILVYISVIREDNECSLALKGIGVSVPRNKIVDNTIVELFKYSNTIVEEGEAVMFYIDPAYTLGVYYAICKNSQPRWNTHYYVDPHEVEYFSKGE